MFRSNESKGKKNDGETLARRTLRPYVRQIAKRRFRPLGGHRASSNLVGGI